VRFCGDRLYSQCIFLAAGPLNIKNNATIDNESTTFELVRRVLRLAVAAPLLAGALSAAVSSMCFNGSTVR
jgi:hypothetical protein